MKMIAFAPILALAALACTSEPADSAKADPAPQVRTAAASQVQPAAEPAAGSILRLSPQGLATAQPGLHSANLIAFDQPRAQVVAAVAAIRGEPTGTSENDQCGAGPMGFTEFGPLTLNFQQGRFVGWELSGAADPPIEEEYGLGIGTSRADLEQSDQGPATIEESSLGTEFDFGGIGGLLSSDAPGASTVRTPAPADAPRELR